MIEDIKKAIIAILLLSAVGGVLVGVALSTSNAVVCLFLLVPIVITDTHIITDLFHVLDDLERRH